MSLFSAALPTIGPARPRTSHSRLRPTSSRHRRRRSCLQRRVPSSASPCPTRSPGARRDSRARGRASPSPSISCLAARSSHRRDSRPSTSSCTSSPCTSVSAARPSPSPASRSSASGSCPTRSAPRTSPSTPLLQAMLNDAVAEGVGEAPAAPRTEPSLRRRGEQLFQRGSSNEAAPPRSQHCPDFTFPQISRAEIAKTPKMASHKESPHMESALI